jgi:hypothetical protein
MALDNSFLGGAGYSFSSRVFIIIEKSLQLFSVKGFYLPTEPAPWM